MRHFLLVIVLSSYISLSQGGPTPENKAQTLPQKYGSHNLLKLQVSDSSVSRTARCTPCGTSAPHRPTSNQLNPEYRGNGADNLGYDWSPMAWGGPAFPQRAKMPMGGMRGRDPKQMPEDRGSGSGRVHVICDTCRAYWDEGSTDSSGDRQSSNRGRQYPISGQQTPGNSQPRYWQDGRMKAQNADFETRVSSPTVGVLVKPGSRIAYVPSRSGEMYWDGVSGGGTRWDGFSNGISWVSNGSPEWDRSDTGPREEKSGPDSATSRPGADPSYTFNSFRPWDYKGNSGWNDNTGRNYYFTNGAPSQNNHQWADKGYASNWHYGSTNEFGWDGNNMKWNYGRKQWDDNDRASNRFYFNLPQDRTYRPSGGNHLQYGNRYPNYQSTGVYPINFRPRPSWRPDGGIRVNDRDPSNFPSNNYGHDDKNRPWDYNSGGSFGSERPGQRPQWLRPGPSSPSPADIDKNSWGKFPGPYQDNFPKDKLSALDKNDYNKPWNRPTGYGGAKPGSGGGFPYGGNRFPGENRPNYPGNNLFYPSDGTEQQTYPNIDYDSGGSRRPVYQNNGGRPGGYLNTGNEIGSYPSSHERPSTGHQGGGKPSVVYTGGRPSEGSFIGHYPNTDSSTRHPAGGGYGSNYPSQGSFSDRYPGTQITSGGYSDNGGRPGSGGSYPSGGGSPNRYPGGGRPSGYPGDYPSSESSYSYEDPHSNRYPGGSGSSNGGNYPNRYSEGNSPFGRPDASGFKPVNTKGGGHPSGIGRPYQGNGFSGYSGDRPIEYPSGSFASGPYPVAGNRPTGYPIENERLGGYPNRGQPSYPGSSLPGGSYSQGGKNPQKGYYTGFITELSPDDGYAPNRGGYPGDKNSYGGKDREKYPYGGDTNRYSYGEKNRYPVYPNDRFSGGGGGSYPLANKDKYPGYDQGSDRYYYGQNSGKGKYPGGYSSSQGYSGGIGGGDYGGNSGSNEDKNSWNYGQDERKEGIYRRSGGSYPPYRGGQYFTSSYLASISTTSGSNQEGAETKTQNMTKVDEVTQPTSA